MLTLTHFSNEQWLFLERLHRLVLLDRQFPLDGANDTDYRQRVHAIAHAMLSTYLDCRALGVSIEAHNILHAS